MSNSPTSTAIPTAPPVRLPRIVKAVRTRAPMVPVTIQQRALQATAKFVELARQKFGVNFPMPDVAFDLRGRTAGQAYCEKNLIRYNAVLLTENTAAFEMRTIPHEVAHLIAFQCFGPEIDGHGVEWQRVMRTFGIKPSRCHSYDITNSAVGGVHHFTCKCGKDFPLSARQSKSARSGRIKCLACNGVLRAVGSAPPQPTLVARPSPSSRVPAQPSAKPVPSSVPAPIARPGSPLPRIPVVAPPASISRPATPAMLQYALSLAHRFGIALQPEHTANFEACSDFITRFKSLGGAGSNSVPAPSEKQLRFARDLAKRKGLLLGADVLSDAKKLSAWLTANR